MMMTRVWILLFTVLSFLLTSTTAIRRIDRVEDNFVSTTSHPTWRNNNVPNHTTHVLLERKTTGRVKVEIPSSPDGHLVMDPLPLTKQGEQLTTRHWAGHLPASGDQQKYFFYWLFEPETVDENTPLLIWLNGGPACSSMDGLFLENGPIQWTLVNGQYMLQRNPHSWHHAPAYTVYIDQPVGTGLSFTTNRRYPRNDEEVNVDFYYFLTSFLQFHADKFVQRGRMDGTVSRPVFFSGESHAGHYIPSMMNYILKQNARGAELIIPLAGAAIGNGYFDPVYQYAAAEAAYGHGLVDRSQLNSFYASEQQCQTILKQGRPTPDVCYALLDDILDQSYGRHSPYQVSSYDVRLSESKKGPRKFPKGHHITETYLGGKRLPNYEREGTLDGNVMNAVLEVLHATAATAAGQTYEECTDPPYDALADQDGKGVVPDIIQVLQDPSKPRLLFFNGVHDLICNHVGNERALENLPWQGRDDWATAERYAWQSKEDDKQPAGYMKEYDNLLFLKLLNAGHMVPMDLPEVSLDMMRIFMTNGSFRTRVQQLDSTQRALPDSCSPCKLCPLPPNNCSPCPHAGGRNGDCSEEIERAEKEAFASLTLDDDDDGIGVVPVAAGIILVVVFLIYGILERRKRKQRQRIEVATSTLELQPQYRDGFVVGSNDNGVI